MIGRAEINRPIADANRRTKLLALAGKMHKLSRDIIDELQRVEGTRRGFVVRSRKNMARAVEDFRITMQRPKKVKA